MYVYIYMYIYIYVYIYMYIYIYYLKSTENQMHFMNPNCSGTILDHPRILRPSEGLKSGEEIAAAAKRGMLTWHWKSLSEVICQKQVRHPKWWYRTSQSKPQSLFTTDDPQFPWLTSTNSIKHPNVSCIMVHVDVSRSPSDCCNNQPAMLKISMFEPLASPRNARLSAQLLQAGRPWRAQPCSAPAINQPSWLQGTGYIQLL